MLNVEMPSESPERTAIGLDANVAAALAYSLGWVTGIAVLLVERNNRFVRFHAMQSTIVFALLSAVSFVLQAIPLLNVLIAVFVVIPVSAVLWLILMFRAYRGERWLLPVVGPMAEAATARR